MTSFIILLLETIFLGLVAAFLYRGRKKITLIPFYVFLGMIWILANFLTSFLYLNVLGFLISPGSSIFFSCFLFSLLIITCFEGIKRAWQFILGIIFVGIFSIIFNLVTFWQMKLPYTLFLFDVPENLFYRSAPITFWGLLIFIIDVTLVIGLLWVFRKQKIYLTLSVFLALWLTLLFDSVIFSFAAFATGANFSLFSLLLKGQIIGKSLAAFIYSVIFFYFLRKKRALEARELF